jgi:hypothetical protein
MYGLVVMWREREERYVKERGEIGDGGLDRRGRGRFG